ncbi:MAG: hypothetical protein OEY68_01250 [Gammaproteobacteria bacterium]|nr:hypothetical protein [Gammaproteobacteria bacterium]
MIKVFKLTGQLGLYGLFALVLGYFSTEPVYVHTTPDQAVIRLTFNHVGNLKEKCRRFTAEEIANTPPNMRQAMDCPRERLPVYLEMLLDGKQVYNKSIKPSGLSGDGEAVVNEKFIVSAGRHHLSVRMRDSHREQGFDYEKSEWMDIKSRQNMVISFIREKHSFVFK